MGRFCVVNHTLQIKELPPTYQRIVNMAFKEYFGMSMKLFFNDFNVLSDLKTHLAKL
jgi:hypothetical protein